MLQTKYKLALIVFVAIGFTVMTDALSQQTKTLLGVVYEDRNKNSKRDKGEPGVPGVMVSNQEEGALTNANGEYTLPIKDETVIFITKPAGYATPLNAHNLPQFYYIHQPKGSPPLKYKGVAPTGNLPKTIDFPLYKVAEPDTFTALIFSDPQPRSHEEISFIRDDIVSELIGTSARLGIALGDIMYDDLSLYERYNEIMATLGIPMYNVPGNHDMNFDAPSDAHSLETFKRIYGPPYYSFDYGKVHFIVLDDVEYLPDPRKEKGPYRGLIGEKQLKWLANDLRHVSKDRLVVLTMHIPFKTVEGDDPAVRVVDKDRLFALLKDREHLLALAGHIHTIEHHALTADDGWNGKQPFQLIVCAAFSGAWWSGPADGRGIPSADQRDGVPNGYHLFHFQGNTYEQIYKPASLDPSFQLRVSFPMGILHADSLANQKVVVNVFNGDANTEVRFKIDDGPYQKMQNTVMTDPFIKRQFRMHRDKIPSWINAVKSTHIWVAPMPEKLAAGTHVIRAEAKTQQGGVFKAQRIFEVR